MVWGMNPPSSFGEFWPDGHFEGEAASPAGGWFERLRNYFKAQPIEEQRRLFDCEGDAGNAAHFYPGQVSAKSVQEIGTVRGADMPPLTPTEPHEPPRFFETCKNYGSLGSLIMLNNRILAVDQALRDIIELMEAGCITSFRSRSECRREQFSRSNITRSSSANIPTASRRSAASPVAGARTAITPSRHGNRKADMAGLAFSSAVFGKAHLWRERRGGEGPTLFSDEKAAIEQAGLRRPKLNKMKEV